MSAIKREWERRWEESRKVCEACEEKVEQCDCAYRCLECHDECRIVGAEKEDTHTIWICNSCADIHISPVEAL